MYKIVFAHFVREFLGVEDVRFSRDVPVQGLFVADRFSFAVSFCQRCVSDLSCSDLTRHPGQVDSETAHAGSFAAGRRTQSKRADRRYARK